MALQFKKIKPEEEIVDGYDLVSEEIDEQQEIVVELALTESQLRTLRWVLICWLGRYESNEGSVYKNDVRAMSDALEGI